MKTITVKRGSKRPLSTGAGEKTKDCQLEKVSLLLAYEIVDLLQSDWFSRQVADWKRKKMVDVVQAVLDGVRK